MITYKQGNIFDSQCQILVNPVNGRGVLGAGLALQFKQRYPEIERPYKQACNCGQLVPGSLVLAQTKQGKWVLHFPTKDHWGNQSQFTDIARGFEYLMKHIGDWRTTYNLRSIAFPALGCGLGGLKWEEVRAMMQYYLNLPEMAEMEIEIYVPNGETIVQEETAVKQQEPEPVRPETPGREGPLVYVYGYSKQSKLIEDAMKRHKGKVLLIDTRWIPRSSVPGHYSELRSYDCSDLAQYYGKAYRMEGEYLGNRNKDYPERGFDIPKLDEGLERLCNALRRGYTLVLICGCGHERCHRFEIMKKLVEKWTREHASRLGEITIQESEKSATLVLK